MSITNKQYLKALCHDKPYANYARMFGYTEDKENGTAVFKNKVDFKRFEAEPAIANEFLGDFYNKIIAQHIVNLFEEKPLQSKFARFLRSYGKIGDIEEYVTSKLQTIIDYDSDTAPTNPFEVSKPQVVLSFVKTEDKELAFITLNYEQWYGAFINATGLDSLASQCLSQLNDALELDIYDKICADLGDVTKFPKTSTITTIASAGEEANAKKAYEEIMFLRNKMNLPSKTGEYNIGSLKNSGTPYSRMVLILNSRYTSSFQINVLATLFNSNKIELPWVTIEFPEADANVVGILMDERAYVYGYRINFVQSIMNPRNMFINTFNHRWTKRGVVPMYNAVVLKTA